MKLRGLRRDDAAPLLAMWNATARFDPLTPDLLEEKTWDDPGFEPGLALVCEDQAGIAGFAMGVVRGAVGGARGIVKLAAAAADRRRRGIGSRLLGDLENRLLERGVTAVRVCESAPNYLTPGVDSRYSAAPYFFEQQGYERIGEACNMTVDLSAPAYDLAKAEARVAGHGLSTRRAGPGDRESLAALLAAAFVWWLLNRSVLGFQFRAVGANPSAARTAGIKVERTLLRVALVSGAIAGVAGVSEVAGIQFRLTEGVSGTGIGLTIARQQARRLGGDLVIIDVENGACFELRLPLEPGDKP